MTLTLNSTAAGRMQTHSHCLASCFRLIRLSNMPNVVAERPTTAPPMLMKHSKSAAVVGPLERRVGPQDKHAAPKHTPTLPAPNLATAGPAKQPRHATASRLPPLPPTPTNLRQPPACAATHRALTADGQAARLSGGAGCLPRPPQVLAMRLTKHKAFAADPLRRPTNTTQFHRWQLATATITNAPSRTTCLHRHPPCADCRRTGSPPERWHWLPSTATIGL